jgi:hypothetical protein
VVRDRHRDRHVDPDHADLDPAANSRAASPLRVKIATPLPYWCSLGSRSAVLEIRARTIWRTGPKISSL